MLIIVTLIKDWMHKENKDLWTIVAFHTGRSCMGSLTRTNKAFLVDTIQCSYQVDSMKQKSMDDSSKHKTNTKDTCNCSNGTFVDALNASIFDVGIEVHSKNAHIDSGTSGHLREDPQSSANFLS